MSLLEGDEDPVKQVRRIRDEMSKKFKTIAALCDYIREEERKDPKCNPALRRKKAKATKPVVRRRAAPARAARKGSLSSSR